MKRIGIWIDQREANIIELDKKSVETKTIYSDVETRVRVEGEKKQFGRFGDQYLVDEKGKKSRIEEYMQRYLNRLLSEMKGADEIMLFGPAQAKSKLEKKMMNEPELLGKLKAVNVTENMTMNQKIAYVKDFYKN